MKEKNIEFLVMGFDEFWWMCLGCKQDGVKHGELEPLDEYFTDNAEESLAVG